MNTYIEINCKECGKSFLKVKSEYNRQLKKNPSHNFYCCKECSYISLNTSVSFSCIECGKVSEKKFSEKERKFCNQSCAARYSNLNRDELVYIEHSKKLKQKYLDYPELKPQVLRKKEYCNIYFNLCKNCNSIFLVSNDLGNLYNKTCSNKCCRELMSKNSRSNPNCGGITNFRKFKYKDVWFDSSWEIKVAEYLDFKLIEWIHSRKICFKWIDKDNKERRYHPDFFLPKHSLYLDTKNKYLQIQDKFKIDYVRDFYKINLIVGDLNYVLDYLRIL